MKLKAQHTISYPGRTIEPGSEFEEKDAKQAARLVRIGAATEVEQPKKEDAKS